MKPTDRIPTSFSPGTPIFGRFNFMIGHHDMRVYLTDTGYVDVGAGSLPLIKRMVELPGARVAGRLGAIGRFCEFSESAKIIVHGEHENDNVVNTTFAGFPMLRGRNKTGQKPYAPFNIGNGVVASRDALIMGGKTIGDGVVIGASAVVTKDLDAHGIYAGVPAKRLRDRPRGAAWWDFDIAYLISNMENIEDVATNPAASHVYRREAPRIAVKFGATAEVLGAVDGEHLTGFSQMPERVRDYIIQAMNAEQPYWVADCWA
jgi:acetyltransferase-like isoleucine patch superfamily enzyme